MKAKKISDTNDDEQTTRHMAGLSQRQRLILQVKKYMCCNRSEMFS